MKLRPALNSILLSLLLAGGAAAAPKPAAGVLTNARIAQMLQAGTSEKTIIAMIRRFPDGLDDGPDALVALRRAGASSPLLLELRANAQAVRVRRRESAAQAEEAPEAETVEQAAPQAEQPEPAPAPARRRKAPVGSAVYDEKAAEAEDAVNARDYFRADKIYAHLLEALPDDDKRRVYLYERRGWLAAKRNDFAAARDLYLKAADAMRALTCHDTTSVRVYAGLGNALEKLDSGALAVRYYKRALEICKDSRQRQQIQARLDNLQ